MPKPRARSMLALLQQRPYWYSKAAKLYCGDCVELLSRPGLIPEARLVFADPPYNQGIDYGEGAKADKLTKQDYYAWSIEWLTACADCLTEDGSLWVLAPDEWVADFVTILDNSTSLARRSWVKWYETFGVNCKRKFNRCSRHLLHYVVNEKSFVFNREAVTRPSDRQTKYNDKRASAEGKLWDDVWQIPRLAGTHKERLRWAPTQLPLALLRPVVGCCSNEGDVVLDPFSGSGTTGVVCMELGRRYVGIEKSRVYCNKSSGRLEAVL